MKKNWSLFFITALFLDYTSAFADPWFTGPLLASSGQATPLGSYSLETYGYYTHNTGSFTRSGKLTHAGAGESIQINPIFTYGLTDRIDMQFNLPYTINRIQGQMGRHIGDAAVMLGYQLLEQKDSYLRPDTRITLQEVFPTGRFEELNPDSKGTDGTGQGSYQTTFGLNFQNLTALGNNHYLNTYLSLSYLYAQSVHITGLNSYGGTLETTGKLKPGNLISIDLAGELTLTQNWVAVMEAYYFTQQATKFRGFSGRGSRGLPTPIGNPYIRELSLAPAIEYNFSANFGIIAGMWFAIKSKDATEFQSAIIAINASW